MDNPYDIIRANDAALVRRLRDAHPSLIDFSTGRVLRLLEAFARPQDRLAPVIHVAGTNGKGSTVAFIRAIAEAAGLKAHVLTSPHLVRFAERIRVAGKLISEEELSALIDRVEAANDGQPISFHETNVVIALLAFSETPADICIVEVGLGGRFDCTNVFDAPAVTVIAPVDYDHVDWLGPKLANIAWEKAGIIKRGRPCIIARQQEEARAMIESEAARFYAPLVAFGCNAHAYEHNGKLCLEAFGRKLELPRPGLFGPHQFENAALAVTALIALGDGRIREDAYAAGIAGAIWPARWQRLKSGPLGVRAEAAGATLWLDGAHNPHGGRALAKAIAQLRAEDPRPTTLIVGMFARKDPRGFFAPFAGSDVRVLTVPFSANTAADPHELASAAREAGLNAAPAADVSAALETALDAEPHQHVVICGGLHFAGDVLAMSPETWPT
jgi:dihydrofolate synthase/folylpolyglutamate synthase